MTRENIELAQGAIGKLGAMLDLLDEYVVWDARTYAPLDEPGVHFGKEAVTRIITRWVDSCTDYRFEVEETIDAGDSVVLAISESGRGRASGAPMKHSYCQVWTFRDGRIVRAEAFQTTEEARAALGLPEPRSSN
jgi:ketosteroid isomerase-like protein